MVASFCIKPFLTINFHFRKISLSALSHVYGKDIVIYTVRKIDLKTNASFNNGHSVVVNNKMRSGFNLRINSNVSYFIT